MKKDKTNLTGNKNLLGALLVFQFFICFILNAQTLVVSGKVTALRVPVRNASVFFVDNSDTTKIFSALTDASGNYQVDIATSVDGSPTQPDEFDLQQNYPNPFSSATAIPFNLNKQSDVHITIFDILGREVRRFSAGIRNAGSHQILWDGRNNFGQKAANGVYLYKLQVGNESKVKKMVLNSSGRNDIIPLYYGGLQKTGRVSGNNIQAAIYTIRVENSDNTVPAIVPQIFENVSVQNDTIINITVQYITTAAVNPDSLHQNIRGFGAANILPWRPNMTDKEIETAFGTGEGQLGFTILRLMIQPDINQWSMNISTAKKAYDRGAIIFASPWNAPTEMAEVVNGQTRVRYDKYNEYAARLDSFNTYMTGNGVPLYAISVQNEPDYAKDWTGWTADEIFRFMKENAHVIRTRVIAPESFQFRHEMSDAILKDSVASANLDIVGGHIYGAGLAPYPLATAKGKELWMTEHLTESSHSANVWTYALNVAKEIQDCMQANMNAYIWWYIVRYYGPIGDGEKSISFPNEQFSAKGEVTKKGYVMSQFARFVRPGFYRVEAGVSPKTSRIDITAYKDPVSSKVVMVVINPGNTQTETVFRLGSGSITTFTPYTTSESKNCEKGQDVNITGSSFTYTLDPLSITTFVSN